ncbi:MAG: Exodeoxyribonuclease 7 large subunit [Candidatus Saccharibacteria bacterium]|nr:Exodeoxyribonuclease 7 large subunit [Candidatus Saccharibacteria bacterium]
MEPGAVEIGVGELVALINQTFDYAYPSVTVTGELANLRVSKGKWLYFALKDEFASVKFFGTVYMLPGPLEDGMLLKVVATPRLHNLYGFSMNVQSIQPAGEGSIRKAAELLQLQLTKEGLFDESRKRPLPYPPARIGLITSRQSAAYADFTKILNARWGGVAIDVIDVQVQGEPAPRQIVAAIEQFNAMAEPPEVLILIRGGGSAEDLAAFSTEQVTRAVAASRVPTLVAIGHEVDLSLAELAADRRASTPSNAAELLVPDRQHELQVLSDIRKQLGHLLRQSVTDRQAALARSTEYLQQAWQQLAADQKRELALKRQLLMAYDPAAALKRGYAILRDGTRPITSVKKLKAGQAVVIDLQDGQAQATINHLGPRK